MEGSQSQMINSTLFLFIFSEENINKHELIKKIYSLIKYYLSKLPSFCISFTFIMFYINQCFFGKWYNLQKTACWSFR